MALTAEETLTKGSKSSDEIFPVKMVETEDGRFFVPKDDVERPRQEYEFSDLDTKILAEAFRHQEGARAFNLPVLERGGIFSRWENWRHTLFAESSKFKSCREVLHYAQSEVPFDHREKWSREKFDITLALMANEFSWFQADLLKLGDNPKSIPDTIAEVDGIIRSNILFWHLRALCFCRHFAPSAQVVMEIGGGYGGLARLWLHEGTVKKYIIVDIPESLFFAEVVLRDEFGSEKIGYWEGKDPGTQIVLLPVNRINEYKGHVGLVINIGSMQEMSDPWIDFYMRWLDELQPSLFYSINYMGQPIDNMFESRAFWAPRPSAHWGVRVMNTEPALIKMLSPGRHFCEILYGKVTVKRSLNEWEMFRGGLLTRDSYLKGLELLRQDFSPANAYRFLEEITKSKYRFHVPKELFYICAVLKEAGENKFDAMFKQLVTIEKMMSA